MDPATRASEWQALCDDGIAPVFIALSDEDFDKYIDKKSSAYKSFSTDYSSVRACILHYDDRPSELIIRKTFIQMSETTTSPQEKSEPIMHRPHAVTKALMHVRRALGNVDRVVFWVNNRWAYMTPEHEVVDFTGYDVDIALLEDAVNAVGALLPVAYELTPEELDTHGRTVVATIFGNIVLADLGNTQAAQLQSYINFGGGEGIDAIESMVLAHHRAGVDVTSVAYVEGLETAIEALANNCDE